MLRDTPACLATSAIVTAIARVSSSHSPLSAPGLATVRTRTVWGTSPSNQFDDDVESVRRVDRNITGVREQEALGARAGRASEARRAGQ
ncbi:hypothetical protein GCM10022255_077810 [Dactylosporangium darangshiense]|uniref:Secreted protein n=1 Tax=Dactylosporangium darangshiense TaxID=579108 RepID=A0ABP8DKU9_9ACTN